MMRREIWRAFRAPKPLGREQRPGDGRLRLADVRPDDDDVQTEFVTDWDDLSGVEVMAGEFVTATADAGGNAIQEPIRGLLQNVRARTGMDVVFISQFLGNERLVRHVAVDAKDPQAVTEGAADPLEATYCQRIVDGRLPGALPDAQAHPESAQLPLTHAYGIRAHVAVPVVTRDGRVFGTVCAYAHQPRLELHEPLSLLRSVARALARALDHAQDG
jgi:hypothetical protein